MHIYANERGELVNEIIELCEQDGVSLMGYCETESAPISLLHTCCFIVEDKRIFALTDSGKWQIKCRLYRLEEILPQNFVKINQSCIANIKMIERFESSFAGALTVRFKNGYCDYVSRRNLKAVKERLGLK